MRLHAIASLLGSCLQPFQTSPWGFVSENPLVLKREDGIIHQKMITVVFGWGGVGE